jgi:DNA adenine methylase
MARRKQQNEAAAAATSPACRPMFKWQGGKSKLAKDILPKFPKHDCYVELFMGGAALFFLREELAKVSVLNDVNGELVNLYRVVQNHLPEFLRQFECILSSREQFQLYQQTNPASLTDVQRAVRWYYLQQHAFGGRMTGQTFGTSTTHPVFDATSLEAKLKAGANRLAKVSIEHLPWLDCAKRYDRPHTFFYADPPYLCATDYGTPFGMDEYMSLAAWMGSCQGKVMLSINDHPAIREVFAEFAFDELTLSYSSGLERGKKTTELLYRNWP